MTSYEVDLQPRRKALGVTPEVDRRVLSLAAAAAAPVRPALESYLQVWKELPGFDVVVRERGSTLLDAEAGYFAELFGAMDASLSQGRRMMQNLKASVAAMNDASRRMSVNGERFDAELGRFSSKLTAA